MRERGKKKEVTLQRKHLGILFKFGKHYELELGDAAKSQDLIQMHSNAYLLIKKKEMQQKSEGILP